MRILYKNQTSQNDISFLGLCKVKIYLYIPIFINKKVKTSFKIPLIMIKYLEIQIKRLKELKMGIERHREKWKLLNESPEVINEHVNELEKLNNEIAHTKKLLSEKLGNARNMKNDKSQVIERLEKKAIGLHADEEEMLNEYKINSNKQVKSIK